MSGRLPTPTFIASMWSTSIPTGTAAPFLDAAIQCLADGGLLCVTCTDAGVFASNGYPEKAYALYGGIPCKGPWSHEAGLRIILNAIATTASKYGVAVEPLLSLSIDFYARVFVRLHKSPQDVKMLAGTTMMVYNCDAGLWSLVNPTCGEEPGEARQEGWHLLQTQLFTSSICQPTLRSLRPPKCILAVRCGRVPFTIHTSFNACLTGWLYWTARPMAQQTDFAACSPLP